MTVQSLTTQLQVDNDSHVPIHMKVTSYIMLVVAVILVVFSGHTTICTEHMVQCTCFVCSKGMYFYVRRIVRTAYQNSDIASIAFYLILAVCRGARWALSAHA
jgi:hypothetical protein